MGVRTASTITTSRPVPFLMTGDPPDKWATTGPSTRTRQGRATVPDRFVSQHGLTEKLGVVGGGTIAVGLASLAAPLGEVFLRARSEASAERVRAHMDDDDQVVMSLEELVEAGATFVVEAVVEDHDTKVELLGALNELLPPDAILASTTSSLSIERI